MLCVMTRSALSRSSSNMSSVSRSASAALLSRARMSRSRSVSLVIGRLRDLISREVCRGHARAVGDLEMQYSDGGRHALRAGLIGSVCELDTSTQIGLAVRAPHGHAGDLLISESNHAGRRRM